MDGGLIGNACGAINHVLNMLPSEERMHVLGHYAKESKEVAKDIKKEKKINKRSKRRKVSVLKGYQDE